MVPLQGNENGAASGQIIMENYSSPKQTIVRITNDDELCCARAIVVAKAITDEDPRVKTIKDSWSHLQETLARELHEEAMK